MPGLGAATAPGHVHTTSIGCYRATKVRCRLWKGMLRRPPRDPEPPPRQAGSAPQTPPGKQKRTFSGAQRTEGIEEKMMRRKDIREFEEVRH